MLYNIQARKPIGIKGYVTLLIFNKQHAKMQASTINKSKHENRTSNMKTHHNKQTISSLNLGSGGHIDNLGRGNISNKHFLAKFLKTWGGGNRSNIFWGGRVDQNSGGGEQTNRKFDGGEARRILGERHNRLTFEGRMEIRSKVDRPEEFNSLEVGDEFAGRV